MEVGGYVMLAIIVVLALGCINSSLNARKEKQAGHPEGSTPQKILSISPFIFISAQKRHSDCTDAAFVLKRRTAVSGAPLLYIYFETPPPVASGSCCLSAASAAEPPSDCEGVTSPVCGGSQPKKYSKRS